MTETFTPLETSPFPEGPSERPRPPHDPLEGDWAEGLRAPLRALEIPRPRLLGADKGEGAASANGEPGRETTGHPLITTRAEHEASGEHAALDAGGAMQTEQIDLRTLEKLRAEEEAKAAAALEVEAPEAWADAEADQLASVPPPPRKPDGEATKDEVLLLSESELAEGEDDEVLPAFDAPPPDETPLPAAPGAGERDSAEHDAPAVAEAKPAATSSAPGAADARAARLVDATTLELLEKAATEASGTSESAAEAQEAGEPVMLLLPEHESKDESEEAPEMLLAADSALADDGDGEAFLLAPESALAEEGAPAPVVDDAAETKPAGASHDPWSAAFEEAADDSAAIADAAMEAARSDATAAKAASPAQDKADAGAPHAVEEGAKIETSAAPAAAEHEWATSPAVESIAAAPVAAQADEAAHAHHDAATDAFAPLPFEGTDDAALFGQLELAAGPAAPATATAAVVAAPAPAHADPQGDPFASGGADPFGAGDPFAELRAGGDAFAAAPGADPAHVAFAEITSVGTAFPQPKSTADASPWAGPAVDGEINWAPALGESWEASAPAPKAPAAAVVPPPPAHAASGFAGAHKPGASPNWAEPAAWDAQTVHGVPLPHLGQAWTPADAAWTTSPSTPVPGSLRPAGAADSPFAPLGPGQSLSGDDDAPAAAEPELAKLDTGDMQPLHLGDADLLTPLDELHGDERPTGSALRLAGEHRVAVQTRSGHTKRGLLRDADLSADKLTLHPTTGGSIETIAATDVKAVFFMLAPGERSSPGSGGRVRITFVDGRMLEGDREGIEAREGFFIVPADASRTNTKRIYVARAALLEIQDG